MSPAIVIAGVRSGVGKTTIATGIMGALVRRGRRVQPFKAGPDYIDPSYHQLACGVPSRNLDTWLLPHTTVAELFQRASARADLSVIEGVMGVFDGHSSLTEEGSTAQLAKLLNVPVVLVADAAKVARSVAAEVLGYQQFDPDLRIAGVILNGVGGPRHLEFCQPQIEATTGLPVLGYLPRREELLQPERHLGLIPTVEGTVVQEWYDALIQQVEATIDLDRILQIAATASPLRVSPQVFPEQIQPSRARIAIARDKAFSFYYQDSLDLLEAWGAELVTFSPLEDNCLPEAIGGIYIGGGFPELFARELSENAPMRRAVSEAVRREIPVYAECGGLMYLGQSLSDMEGTQHPMVGAIPVVSSMNERRLHLGYREIEARGDGPLLRQGEQVRGHEFHWSVLEQPPSEGQSVYKVVDQEGRPEGFQLGSVWASYIHVHLASKPSLARRFVEVCSHNVKTVTWNLPSHTRITALEDSNMSTEQSTEPGPQSVKGPRINKGLVIVNTGNGKGKTTAAMGVLFRAWGRDMKVIMLQFIKHSTANFGEQRAAQKAGIPVRAMGDGFTWRSRNLEQSADLARALWEDAREVIASDQYNVVILDEFTYPMHYGWIPVADVIAVLKNRPEMQHIIITGRHAPEALVEFADLVTEMKVVKHPYEKGIKAQPGIEF